MDDGIIIIHFSCMHDDLVQKFWSGWTLLAITVSVSEVELGGSLACWPVSLV